MWQLQHAARFQTWNAEGLMDTFVVKEQEWQILRKAQFDRPQDLAFGSWSLLSTFAFGLEAWGLSSTSTPHWLGHQVEHFVFSFFSTFLSSVHCPSRHYWRRSSAWTSSALLCPQLAWTIVHLVPELSSSETVLKLFWSNPPANVRLLTQGQARLLAGARKRPDPKLS